MSELWKRKNSERIAEIIIYMYVCQLNGDYGQTNEILSNMETKLFLVLHVDHKPLNIKTTQRNRLRNLNAIVLFIQKNRSSIIYLRLFTCHHLVSTSQQRAEAVNGASMYMSMCNGQLLNFLILICGHIKKISSLVR